MSAAPLELELPGGARACFTTRAEGNMSSVGGQGCEQGEANRSRLARSLGLEGLARGYQVHGTHIEIAHGPAPAAAANEGLAQADGQATTRPGLGVMVMSADCMAIALAGAGTVAVVHAGWRGLAAGVIEQGVAALRDLGASEPPAAAVGPCAGPCCYEVGPEVHEALGEPARERGAVDLRAIAHRRLRAAGVSRIQDVGLCTICETSLFSHRREGQLAGRMAGVAWLS